MRKLFSLMACFVSFSLHAEVNKIINADEVYIENEVGDVLILASDENKIVYEKKSPEDFDKNCEVKLTQDVRKVKFVSKNKWRDSAKLCSINIKVYISSSVDKKVNISMASGHVFVKTDLDDLTVDLDTGLVKFEGLKKLNKAELNIKSGSVNLVFDEITENCELELTLGTGNIFLKSKKLPKKGKVNIEVGVGDIELIFPSKQPFFVDHFSAFGRVYSELPISKSSGFILESASGIGKMIIKERK